LESDLLIQDRLAFARVLRRLALAAGKVLVRHPTPAILVAYDAGRLPPEQTEQLREHFVHCRECPELLLDFQRFAAATGKGEVPPDPEVARAWQELRRRATRDRSSRGMPTRPRTLGIAQALCLLLLIAMAALSLWVLDLRSEVRRLGEPQVNLPVESLTPPSQGAEWVRRIALPAATERFLLILIPKTSRPDAMTVAEAVNPPIPTTAPAVPSAPSAPSEYRLEISTADGRALWSADRLARGADGSFVLGLSRRFLPGGEYRIRLFGKAEGRAALVEEFPILLFYAPSTRLLNPRSPTAPSPARGPGRAGGSSG
jgi:hypothetical protein